MIIPSGTVRVLVATRPVDFRKGMDGLAALVQESLPSESVAGLRRNQWPASVGIRIRNPSDV